VPYVNKSAIEFARKNPTLLGVRLRIAISRHELREAVRKRMYELTAEKERGGK
jgi:hypothetical protein